MDKNGLKLEILYVPSDSIKPYAGNAKKHTPKQIQEIIRSINDNGFIDPIGIWHDEVVEGHGRLIAAQELGMKEVPVIRLDHLTDEQRRAYTLIHNKLTMNTGFDKKLLEIELEKINDIDMSLFDFELPQLESPDTGYYGDERERTNRAYNLDIAHETDLTDDFWQMPVIKKCDHIPDELIGFNYAKTSKEKAAGIHFYVDDYQFERIWNAPEKYTKILSEYDCILTPDFSLYMDMPMPMKIWNVYRSRQIGAFYQGEGLKVIPTLSWAEPETFCFCFRGIEKGSVVSVSTVGVKESSEALEIWKAGADEAIKQIEPAAVLEYGGDIGYDYGDLAVKRFANRITENWK